MPAPIDPDAFARISPDGYAALLALGKAVDDGGLDKKLTEIVKLRVSQINGCAFCLQHHLTIAHRIGVEAAKLDLVAAWRDADVFSDREAAALAWAETLSGLNHDAVPDHAYRTLRDHVSETEAVLLTLAIGTINAWNRIAAGLRFRPQTPFPGADRMSRATPELPPASP
jgi:AhpD family alkylhydroperoxidase